MARAVLFDLDGVLIDSYRAHLESWQALARETGVTLTEEQFAEGFGSRSRDVLRRYWGEDISDERLRALDARKEAIFRECAARAFPAMPGARELLAGLSRDGFALAIGSSAPPENVEFAVDRLGCRPLLGAIVTGADVQHGKPHPQVFLVAAERLGIAASTCAVVEDAPQGIQAARAAGMKVVALASTGRRPEELRAERPDRLVSHLSELAPADFQEL